MRQSWDGGNYCGVWPQIPTCDSPGIPMCDSPGIPMCDSPGMVGVTVVCGLRDPGAAVLGWWELLWCVASETLVRQSWDGGSYCGVWRQRPLCGSPGMVGVTLVCGFRDPCAAVLGWWELPLCVSPGMVGVTVVCGLRDPCAAVCGVWPQRPLCGSPGMVGVTVVCGLRYPRVTVLGWWELLYSI